jgi:hypothetical protein
LEGSIMASIISTKTSGGGGIAVTGDTSGVLQLASNNGTTAVEIDASQVFKFNSGYGSVATAYGCRAWVNFNGTGTVAIRASGNVSSLTDNGVGDYNINYTTSMPDGKYSVAGSATATGGGVYIVTTDHAGDYPTTNVRIGVTNGSGTYADRTIVNVAIFR